MTTSIRIYVANLAAYNSGILAGKWIDLPCADLEAELQSIIDMHEDGEELAIHDYEAPFKIEEYASIEGLNELAEKFDDLSDYDQKKLAYLIDDGCSVDNALDELDDLEFYEDMRLVDVAEQLVDDGCFGEIPASIQNYIDYKAIARDLSYDGYHETSDGVFCRR